MKLNLIGQSIMTFTPGMFRGDIGDQIAAYIDKEEEKENILPLVHQIIPNDDGKGSDTVVFHLYERL